MAKKKSSSKKHQPDAQKQADAQKKADAKAKAKAAAKLATLVTEAKKARKTADKAAKAADKAESKATAAGAPAPKTQAEDTSLLKLALRSTEAKLTDAERIIERLQGQIADLHRVQDEAAEEALEDAIVDVAVAATVAEAIVEAELVADAVTPASEAELVAVELDAVVAEAVPAPEEPSHDGEAAEAAQVLAEGDAGAEPTVTGSEMTPPLPAEPAADEPNESWTLLQLRKAAKDRGLTGTSNLPKAALLERLRA